MTKNNQEWGLEVSREALSRARVLRINVYTRIDEIIN